MVEDVVKSLGFLAMGTRMKRIGERLQADTQVLLEAMELPVGAGQCPLLAAIDMLGPLTIGELAEALGITQPAITRSVNQLADLGYLAVKPAEDDQRRRIVHLTEQGRRLVERAKAEIWPRIEAAVRDLCGGLSGPFLEQLAAVEGGLAARSLKQRSDMLKGQEP
ncbi:MarR family winged helix-turn-helix transcriptional regulator [Pararhizobium arenae]|uniref:MarR family winged helix-turn-helix transcriptional regulator n=1 Tax=Pararhizobium arenae TaxID=1856850 RepID=UPI00094AA70D|nr:MarR family transcriptional regulator [Pararhizobium arenae]